MNIKTNIRAGRGGASGVGKNSPDSAEDVSGKNKPVVVYYPPVSRCTGL